MKKIIIGLCVVVLIAVFGGRAWWLYQHKETGDDIVKIGAVLPMSGIVSDSNKKIVATLNVAKDIIEAENLLENQCISYQLEDGKYTVKDSLSAFNKLITDKPNAIIVLGDVPVYGLKTRIKENKIPTIALITGTADITKNNPYLFRAFHANNVLAEKNSKFLLDKGADTVAILRIKNNYGDDMANTFIEKFEQGGGKVLINESYAMDSLDVRPQIAKILNTNPKAVFITGSGTGYIAAFNQLKENAYEGIVLTESAIMDTEVYSHITNNAEGCYFATAEYGFEQLPTFKGRYQKAIQEEPDIFTAFTLMTMQVLTEAIRRGGTEPEGIRRALLSLKDFDTVMGKVTFNADGELYLDSLSIKQMQADGTAKIVKE
ncbi:MAG: ABC transporter substrate-binding protein [Alphaproteobacteria bacterium]|nr:ABC transporter substrate-binding protein [Alphaproteobacteria bacterium]